MGDFNQEINDGEVYSPPESFKATAHVTSLEEYKKMHRASIEERCHTLC